MTHEPSTSQKAFWGYLRRRWFVVLGGFLVAYVILVFGFGRPLMLITLPERMNSDTTHELQTSGPADSYWVDPTSLVGNSVASAKERIGIAPDTPMSGAQAEPQHPDTVGESTQEGDPALHRSATVKIVAAAPASSADVSGTPDETLIVVGSCQDSLDLVELGAVPAALLTESQRSAIAGSAIDRREFQFQYMREMKCGPEFNGGTTYGGIQLWSHQ